MFRINNDITEYTPRDEIARKLQEGIREPERIAKSHNMVRAFLIAPTASCSYRSTDRAGFTCTPEIALQFLELLTETPVPLSVQTYEYGDVEIASDVVLRYAYKRVMMRVMTTLEKTGLLHGYSFNSWSDMVVYDTDFIEEYVFAPDLNVLLAPSDGRCTRQV